MSDPFGAFRFTVEIGSVRYGMFRECSGLTSEIAVQEDPQGGKITTSKFAGRVKVPNIVLKWGLSDAADAQTLFNWHRDAVEGHVERKDGSVVLLDRDGVTEKMRWDFFGAWPCKLEWPQFNATSDEIAIVTLELAHELLKRHGQ
jgi:phage tail-like protein